MRYVVESGGKKVAIAYFPVHDHLGSWFSRFERTSSSRPTDTGDLQTLSDKIAGASLRDPSSPKAVRIEVPLLHPISEISWIGLVL